MRNVTIKSCLAMGLVLGTIQLMAQGGAPGGVPGSLTLWLKSNASPGKMTMNGTNNVSSWVGENNTVSVDQATAAKQPTWYDTPYPEGVFNFNPSIKFSLTAQTTLRNTLTTPDLCGTAGTIFIVSNAYDPTNSSGSLFTYLANTSYRYQVKPSFRIQTGSSSTGYTSDFNGGPVVNYPTQAARVFVSKANTTNLRSRRNSFEFPMNNNSSTFYPSISAGLSLGANSGTSEYVNMALAEVITFNTTLSAADINKVESYLAVKYGITLDQSGNTNYTSSIGTVIWNSTGNSPYRQNITGIGRDDSSRLMQKQSFSVNNAAKVSVYNGAAGGSFPVANSANTNSLSNNGSFLLYGDDGADTTLKICSDNGRRTRMLRTWKVQETGTLGTVTLAVKKSAMPPQTKTLLVSRYNTFPDTSVTAYNMTDNGTDLYASVDLQNGDYFTFASDSIQIVFDIKDNRCTSLNTGSVVVNVNNAAPPYYYQWAHDGTLYQDSAGGLPPGSYPVTVRYGGFPGCTTTRTAEVKTYTEVLNLVPTLKNVTCKNGNDGAISIVTTNGKPVVTYSVNNGPYTTNSSIKDLSAGTYTIMAKDTDGCVGSITRNINEPEKAMTLNVLTEAERCEQGEGSGWAVAIAGDGTAPYQYGWSKDPTGTDTLKYLTAGSYGIIVTDNKGCKAQQSFDVAYVPCCHVQMPTAFSPNADGQNDVLKPLFGGEMDLRFFRVYNRYGQVIFESTDPKKGWDGTYQGAKCDVSTYFYMLQYSCAYGNRINNMKGNITLLK